MKRITALILLIIAICPLFCSCLDYRETEQLGIVRGIAVDLGDRAKYRVTVEVENTSGSIDSSQPPFIVQNEGDTIYAALSDIASPNGRTLYYSHCRIIVVSPEVAEDGMRSILEWSVRSSEPRQTILLFVSQTSPAASIFAEDDVNSSGTKSETIYNAAKTELPHSELAAVSIHDFLNSASTPGSQAFLPLLDSSLYDGNRKKTDKVIQLFENEYAKETLPSSMMTSFSLLSGNFEIGRVTVHNQNGFFTLALDGGCECSATVDDGRLRFNLQCGLDAALYDIDFDFDPADEQQREAIARAAQQQIKSELETLVRYAQTTIKRDVFGFGEDIYRRQPGKWDEIKQNYDQLFSAAAVEVKVEVNLAQTGLTGRTLRFDHEE